ncbi:type III polyketide synthase [Roseivirga misakiensis]|uniref:Naringenin-chalcone synthase n=1 Tax=Roseivirga misakiensis TaxID=1563681 RepID=A0A1E5T6S6_9BACT|nr:type III polyketide synthase [Roseivirga misakiensis]OEK07063.1 naringenin-chalcone synthase [Roseivirga misakiensis]
MSSSIIAIGTAVPEHKIPQPDVCEFMAKAHGMSGKDLSRLKALYRATGIEQRYSAIADYAIKNPENRTFYSQNDRLDPFPTTKERSDFYKQEAIKLSVRSAKNCLANTMVSLSEITHLITISCTGMYAPGLDIDLVNELGLNKDVERTSINFMGCYAAFVGIKSAHAFCAANPSAKVLVVATELCTLHFQNKTDEETLIANAIFGDGSAAVLVGNSGDNHKTRKLKPLAFHNELFSEGATEMAWEIGNHGYEMKLSAYVPDLIEKGIAELVGKLKAKVSVDTIQHYAFHPGGKRILEVIEKELQLDKTDGWAGREVLKNYGNMSSPTVLFVLKTLLDNLDEKQAGEKVLSLAFGPGLTVESMLLEVV